MKHQPAGPDPKSVAAAAPLKRRGVLIGTGVAAAASVVAAVASRSLQAPASAPVAQAAPTPDADGYRLSQHVLRYYETARV
jgi:hypothetical protein